MVEAEELGSDPHTLRVVAIGGGTGLPVVLRGLAATLSGGQAGLDESEELPQLELTAIVATSDNGGSSGRLRREFGVPAPGDIRNCLVAIAEAGGPLPPHSNADRTNLLSRLFQHRFGGPGPLGGHVVGNVILAALASIQRDFVDAVKEAGELLGVRAQVLPVTPEAATLVADFDDGRIVAGEVSIAMAGGRVHRVRMEPPAPSPSPGVLEALARAHLIVIGPGSLYTSIMPNLLVRGVSAVLATSPALKVLVMNLMTQPGETDGLTAVDHLQALRRHAGSRVCDAVIVNSRPISIPAGSAEGEATQVFYTLPELSACGVAPIEADVLDEASATNGPRHDPAKLAGVLRQLALGALARRRRAA
jgi:uncharacterized cofD-like protein